MRQWGERFPVRATAFTAETRPAREVLADSRTMKGGGAAGVATFGAAGVEVVQTVVAETRSAILQLVPYLDTLRSVFIAVALGIAIVTSLLSGCATVGSDEVGSVSCPPVVEYGREVQARGR